MISLVYPLDTEDRILFVNKMAFPHYGDDFLFTNSKVRFNSKLRAIEETKGMFGENDVIHDKIEGDVEYVPACGSALLEPTTQYPDQMRIPVYSTNSSGVVSEKTMLMSHGIACKDRVTMEVNSSQVIQRVTYRNDAGLWTYKEVVAFVNDPTTVTNAFEYTILGARWNGTPYIYSTSVYVSAQRLVHSTGQLGWKTGINWLTRQSAQTIKDTIDSYKTSWSDTVTNLLGSTYKGRYDKTFSPSGAKQKIDSLIRSLFPEKFPIEDKHFGDLAMEASKSIQANDVNMIAFAKDLYGLRNPKEWAPALKKLSKLRNTKDLSNTYLTGIYGVMPTVSDIQTILKAFKRIGPYIDKNGFKTYGSGHHAELDQDGLHFDLLQRIKLAIPDEDDAFMSLIQRLEDMGTLPTFENVWDLVPYSFVVDWFVDVGGFLERVDAFARISRLNIRYVTMSRKTSIRGTITPKPEASFVGTIDWVHYHRWVSDQCPVPPLSLKTTFQDFNHWLESGALLQQRSNPAITFRRN